MKILHLIAQRPDSTGSGYYLQNIMRLAQEAGYQNHLIAGVPSGNNPSLECIQPQACSFVTFSGGDLPYPVPGMSDVMPYESTLYSTMSSTELEQYEKQFAERISETVVSFSPNIIHSHHLWLATAVARRVAHEVPQVTSCHSTDLRQFIQCPHLRNRLLSECQEVTRVLALSEAQHNQIKDLYGIEEERIDIVGAGYDERVFRYHRREQTSTIHLLYGGKLSFSKGVDWLLRNMGKLTHLPVHLHLAGSGSGQEEEECLRLAEKGKNVTVHGRLSQQELASLMQRCHIFILPSFYEGLPLVLLEALATGCRIVTTRLPGCHELLGNVEAGLVEFIDLPELQQIDRPGEEDFDLLDISLVRGIERMVKRVIHEGALSESQVIKPVHSHSWQEVFRRVERSYMLCLGKDP